MSQPLRPSQTMTRSRNRGSRPYEQAEARDDQTARHIPPSYRWPLAVVIVLVTVQALANLYLPNLNADIINNGVLTGDTGYIIRTGGLNAAGHVPGGRVRCRLRLFRFENGNGIRTRRAQRHLPQGDELLSEGDQRLRTPSLITRNTNDVQQVQMVLIMTSTS